MSEKMVEQMRKEFKKICDKLTGEYVGYIQLSDRRIEDVFTKPQKLEDLGDIYKGSTSNFVLEMALFEPKTSTSILIRQQNDGYLHDEVTLDGNEPIDSYEAVTSDTPKVNMAQIWQEEPDVFCEGMSVLKLKKVVFAGFVDAK